MTLILNIDKFKDNSSTYLILIA